MKRLFVRTAIALVGMTTWLLPNRANATTTCEVPLPNGWVAVWHCSSSQTCAWYIVCHEDDCSSFSLYYGCV